MGMRFSSAVATSRRTQSSFCGHHQATPGIRANMFPVKKPTAMLTTYSTFSSHSNVSEGRMG